MIKMGDIFQKNCCMAVQSPETCCCWRYTFLPTTDAFKFGFVIRDCIDIFVQYMLLLYHAHIACLRDEFYVQTRSYSRASKLFQHFCETNGQY